MDISSEKLGGTLVVIANASRIDAVSAIQFKDALRAATDDGPPRVVLDLSKVEFIDSSGLGAVVAMFKHLSVKGSMELAALQPAVVKLFHLTRLDSVFTIHDTRETALSAG